MMRLESYPSQSKQLNSWRPDLLSSGVALFLFAAAVKPGLSSELETVTYSGLIFLLKAYSQYIGAIGLLLLMFVWVRQPKLASLKFSYPAVWLLIFKLVIALRLIVAPETGYEQLISFSSILALYFVMLARDGKNDSANNYSSLLKGMYYFTIIIVAINMYLFIFEYSTSSWKGRFVGVFHHPNFTGVNFAICASIILGFNDVLNKTSSKKAFTISTILLLLSAFLVIASGSRTGILGYLAAFLAQFYIQKRLKPTTIIFLAFTAFILALSLGSIIEFLAYYIPGIDRMLQAGNTRDGVWASMWGDFISNPFFGSGASVEATAGSYLRVLAIGGIIAATPLSICIILSLVRVFRNKGKYAFRKSWLPGLCCILITSITEGQLADALSVGIIYFVFIVFALSFRRPIHLQA